ncbi:MAG: hypothetical protein DMF92_15970 [Acidobacteria bacterium]|nr:MAG: hypothetical protein DMF92_15970 [Acidobacteriota bacterium]
MLRLFLLLLAFVFAPAATGPHAQGQPVTNMRLYMFDCATLKNRDPGTYSLARDQVQALDMSDPCFLVVHRQGTLLWETGLNDGVYNRTGGGGARHDIIGQSLKSQLAEIGYKPTDITYLAMSHHHGDHSGNANDYASATWIVQKAEREYMFGATKPPTLNNDEYIALKDSKTIVIEGEKDYDVFHDGTVILIATPGHTPGHQSMYLKLPKTGSLVLAGDLWHFPGERTFHTIPKVDMGKPSGVQTAASRAKIEALVKKTGSQLWIQHDIISNLNLKKSPLYYE